MCHEQFRLSQVKLQHSDAKDFTCSLWFPDVAVTIYRCVFAGYCLGWIIYSGFHPANGEEKWFIYLTNWAFTFLTLYFIWATVVCILHHLAGRTNNTIIVQMKSLESNENDMEVGNDQAANSEQAAANSEQAAVVNMSWYHKGLWITFNIAANAAILVTLLYWALIFGGKTSGLDVSTHLINSVFIVADVMLSATPVRILHVVYGWMLGFSYLLLTVIFWAAKGTNARNKPYIYSYLDYNESPGLSSGIVVCFVLVGQPLVQVLLFVMYKLRGFLGMKCGSKP